MEAYFFKKTFKNCYHHKNSCSSATVEAEWRYLAPDTKTCSSLDQAGIWIGSFRLALQKLETGEREKTCLWG